MRRAVIPLVRAGCAVVDEFVADGFPCLASIAGALHHLSEPAARLRRVDAVRVGGRSLHVINFPAGEVRTVDRPLVPLAIGFQYECAFLGSYQYANSAHRSLLSIKKRTGPGSACADMRSASLFINDVRKSHNRQFSPEGRFFNVIVFSAPPPACGPYPQILGAAGSDRVLSTSAALPREFPGGLPPSYRSPRRARPSARAARPRSAIPIAPAPARCPFRSAGNSPGARPPFPSRP